MEKLFEEALVNKIKDLIQKRDETISVAESVTAGLLQSALASAMEASQYFQGGITAYNVGQKYRHLLIDPIHGMACNCVSERVAADMAVNVCNLFQSDWGLGITGYAVPVPESGNKLFAYYAIAYREKIIIKEKIEKENDGPFDVQLFYVNHILTQLLRCLDEVADREI